MGVLPLDPNKSHKIKVHDNKLAGISPNGTPVNERSGRRARKGVKRKRILNLF
jgi:hypothetical protein